MKYKIGDKVIFRYVDRYYVGTIEKFMYNHLGGVLTNIAYFKEKNIQSAAWISKEDTVPVNGTFVIMKATPLTIALYMED